MTMTDFNELAAYWREHPPEHILIAAQVGFKPSKQSVPQPDGLARLLGCDPNTGGHMRILH